MCFRSLTALVILIISIPCNALLLTATPTLTPEKANSVYKPLATLLTDTLGVPVEFEYTENWQEFSYKVLASEYDLIFAEAHIIAYVSSPNSLLSMDVPVKLNKMTRFHVVVDENSTFKKLKDLAAARICMRPSPNFSGVMIKREFSNPVIQPTVIEVKGGFDAVYQRFERKRCQAAVINDDTYKRMSAAGKKMRVVHTTAESPNLALAISQRITPADTAIILKTLKGPSNTEIISPLAMQYADEKTPFTNTQYHEFKAFNILPGVVWGW